jgi:hypothetical protein
MLILNNTIEVKISSSLKGIYEKLKAPCSEGCIGFHVTHVKQTGKSISKISQACAQLSPHTPLFQE